MLTGFIDRPDYVDPIRQIAEDYAPKVINNIAVGGVQQVLLKVKIYEISRTKLRKLGVDIGTIGSGGYFGTSVSGLLQNVGTSGDPLGINTISRRAVGGADRHRRPDRRVRGHRRRRRVHRVLIDALQQNRTSPRSSPSRTSSR